MKDLNGHSIINKNQLLSWRFAPMPDVVRRSPVLSAGAKILYNELVSYIWQKNENKTWVSQSTLAENLSISRQTVSNQLKELKSVGLIAINRRGLNKSNEMYILDFDLAALQVVEDEKGSPKPALTADVKISLHPDVKIPLHQDVKNLTKVDSVQGADSLDVARVPAVVSSAEEESSEEETVESQTTDDAKFFNDEGENLSQHDDSSEVVINSQEWQYMVNGGSRQCKLNAKKSYPVGQPITKSEPTRPKLRGDALLAALQAIEKSDGSDLSENKEVKKNDDGN